MSSFKECKMLDFSECTNVKIYTFNICEVETLKLYSIDIIDKMCNIYCTNLHFCNITETKCLNLTNLSNFQNIYLPEGEYCITTRYPKEYKRVKFYLGDSIFPAKYFKNMAIHKHTSLPVSDLIIIDTPLDTI